MSLSLNCAVFTKAAMKWTGPSYLQNLETEEEADLQIHNQLIARPTTAVLHQGRRQPPNGSEKMLSASLERPAERNSSLKKR